MRSNLHAVLVLSASVAATLGLALVPSAALAQTGAGAAAVKPPTYKSLNLTVELNVGGYVEAQQLTDTASECNWGSHYLQTNEYIFETGKFVKVSLSLVTVPGYDGTITVSRFSRPAGSVSVKGGITEFRTTNTCPPRGPNPLSPICVTNRGKTSVALKPADPFANERDPAPLDNNLMVTVRSDLSPDDATDDPSCFGTSARNIDGRDTERALISTSMASGVSLILPIGLGFIKLRNLKPKQLLKRTIRLSGPCTDKSAEDTVTVFTKSGWDKVFPTVETLTFNGDCWLRGKIVLSVRRAG